MPLVQSDCRIFDHQYLKKGSSGTLVFLQELVIKERQHLRLPFCGGGWGELAYSAPHPIRLQDSWVINFSGRN